MGSRVPAAAGTRLKVPSMLAWRGFRSVIASSERGLKLASPKEGMLTSRRMVWRSSFMIELLMERCNTTPDQKFGPGWFWPALKRYRGVLIQVLAASFVVQLFTLANPLLIQVIIDKVINQRSLDTLQVLGVALVVVTILEGVLSTLGFFYLLRPPTASINALGLRLSIIFCVSLSTISTVALSANSAPGLPNWRRSVTSSLVRPSQQS